LSRPPRSDQFHALLHIRDCLAEHGDEVGMRIARARYPKINKSTWSRWVQRVRAENALHASQPISGPLVSVVDVLPPVAEANVATGVIDFFGQVAGMMAVCDALQDYAWPKDPANGHRKMRNPMLLERATRLRASVLDMSHRRDEMVWSVERSREMQRNVLNAITSVLTKDDSAVARKILDSLRAMDAHHKARARYIGSPELVQSDAGASAA